MALRQLFQSTKTKPQKQARAAVKSEREHRLRLLNNWVMPVGFTAGLAISAYIALRIFDFALSDGKIALSDVLFLTDAEAVGDALGGVSEVLIAILGLVITVVAIVVQLAAQRYTPKLIDLFIADWVNISFFGLMVVASMYSLLLVYSITTDFMPFWGSLFLVIMTTFILSLLIPYFNYVFLFLTPGNIISIIRNNAKKGMLRVLRSNHKPGEIRKQQREVANALEQISDIALSAVTQMDRNVALLCIRTLKDVLVDYLLIKRRMPKRWFYAQKDDFPALSTDFIQEIFNTQIWVEAKGFMDMELIFKTAIKDMPDAVSAVANNTKIIGLYAIRLKDFQVLSNVIQFFNTFLRLAVNNRNPKAIYNLFYQYRMLAEDVLDVDQKLAERIAFYFKYYGQIAQNYNIPLILVTACFDLGYLLERAFEKQVPNLDNLIKTFLELDDTPATQSNEFELRSVRKAQLMFASFVLSKGDSNIAEQIFNDMKDEPQERMEAIRGEMLAVTDRKFWEITDRGVDFFFMEEEQKEHLNLLYSKYFEPHYKNKDEALQPNQV
ncbi:MAG: DUF2254 domain-containing protein [SAR324 cluster bacterium]|nr:DUF2254 domain-containing protein [SAR324 cluster bacterium]